jgi:uncharacterized protein (DUF1697 family)
MNTYIAFLRGINVGGHKKILMEDLRNLLESAGFDNVQTYIQSGNVIFKSSANASSCEQLIGELIARKYGWEVPVIIKEPVEISEILKKCPFSGEKKEKSYFTLLSSPLDEESIRELLELNNQKEELYIKGSCVYFWSENYSGSRFNNNFLERRLKVNATARNYWTILKLIDLSS